MAVAVVMRWDAAEGVDEGLYWKMTEAVGATDALPAGCLSHAAAFDRQDGGLMSEVWESAEAFQQFMQTKVAPSAERIGLPQPASVTVVPVVRYQAA